MTTRSKAELAPQRRVVTLRLSPDASSWLEAQARERSAREKKKIGPFTIAREIIELAAAKKGKKRFVDRLDEFQKKYPGFSVSQEIFETRHFDPGLDKFARKP